MLINLNEFKKVMSRDAVTVHISDGLCSLFVLVLSSGSFATYYLSTARGDLKTFKSLNSLLMFVHKHSEFSKTDLVLSWDRSA
jgi:hypothetical protein